MKGGEVEMKVIDKQPVPIYEVVCYECKSKIQYTASEVSYAHIVCPVCGISLWASTVNPVRYGELKEDT